MPSENVPENVPVTSELLPSSVILEQRVREAAAYLNEDEDLVWKALDALGVEKGDANALALLEEASDDLLSDGMADEALKVFMEAKPLRRRKAWKVLTRPLATDPLADKTAEGQEAIEKLVDVMRPVEQWSDKELMKQYGPDCETRIMDELSKRAKNQTIIVYDSSGKISVDASVELLRLSRRQPAPSSFMVDGKLQHTYRVGEFPQVWVEDCPLHEDTILVNGYCEKCYDTWADVKMKGRILARIAKRIGYFKTSSPRDVRKAIWISRDNPDSLLDVPQIEMKYRELDELDCLPKMRKRISRSKSGGDPFFVHRQY